MDTGKCWHWVEGYFNLISPVIILVHKEQNMEFKIWLNFFLFFSSLFFFKQTNEDKRNVKDRLRESVSKDNLLQMK